MHTVFVQKDAFVKIGIMQLSACLKQRGYTCDIVIEECEGDYREEIVRLKPDLVAFSCTTGTDKWVLKTAKEIKRKWTAPILVGGPHPTFFPEMISEDAIDFICIGEGENALLQLVEAFEQNQDKKFEVQNIWAKRNGEVIRNDVRPLLEDLDGLPFSDWKIYEKYRFLLPYYRGNYPVITGRGCPYNCNYCFNHLYKKLYQGKGALLRRRSVGHVMEELTRAKHRFGIKRVNFVDDAFLIPHQWIRDLASEYREKVGMDFICNVVASSVNEEMGRLLKQMGCICARMGVESGSEALRKQVLNKNITDEHIINAARFLKRNGIRLLTYNMLGLPGETVEKALDTYRLNKKIKTDFAQCSLLQPYPRTQIHEYVKNLKPRTTGTSFIPNGADQLSESFFHSTIIPIEDKREIMNLQKLLDPMLRFRVPTSWVRSIIRLPENSLFRFIFKLSFAYARVRVNKTEIIPFVRMGLHLRSYMNK